MKRTRSKTAPALVRATKRASTLIEAMLREMQSGLKNPKKLETDEWIRLFGDKQSMVVNLQKLVQSLAALTEPPAKKLNASHDHLEEGAMNVQDIQILSAWLAHERAPQGA